MVPINPDVPGYQTVVSQIARVMFGRSWLYYLLQVATALILILAANTSFAGFPRLASIMARDRYLPRQLYNLGDRLVFSNGILLLALLASVLIAVFHGETHALIPLYAVGVFLSFTLSQAGMVRHSVRLRAPGWRRSAVISAVGAISTAVVTLVIASTKFMLGAWIVVLLIPCFVYLFMKIQAAQPVGLDAEIPPALRPRCRHYECAVLRRTKIIPDSSTVLDSDQGSSRYLRLQLCGDHFEGSNHGEGNPGSDQDVRRVRALRHSRGGEGQADARRTIRLAESYFWRVY